MDERSLRTSRLAVAMVSVGLGLLSLGALGAPAASACEASAQTAFGLSPGCADVRTSAAPTSTDLAPDFFQAAGHPYEVSASLRLNAPSEFVPKNGSFWPAEPLKDLNLGFPPGLVADPAAVPPCSVEQLAGEFPSCPASSQVGTILLYTPLKPEELTEIEAPLYVLDAAPGIPARFGFNVLGVPTVLDATVGADGGLAIHIPDLGEVPTVVGLTISLWGVPGEPVHTPLRSCPGKAPPYENVLAGEVGPACPSSVIPTAFLRLPTSCAGPQPFTFGVDSWFHPGAFQSETVETHDSPGLLGDPASQTPYPAPYPGLDNDEWGPPQGFTECDRVPFSPSIEAQADRDPATGQSGLEVEVSQPQVGLEEPEAVSESDLESGAIALPPEFEINPSVASGLTFCTAAEANLDIDAPAACRDSAKLGTVELASPLLSTPMTGAIYAAEPAGQATSTVAIPTYIVAGADGISLKLPSRLGADPGDGRLRASFGPVPQLPLSRIGLHFFGGERAPFVVAMTCGARPLEAELDPWSGSAPARRSASVTYSSGSGCSSAPRPRPFAPGFATALADPRAGAPDALTIKLTRGDGEQEASSLQLALPAGFAAAVGSVETCPDPAVAAAEAQSPTGAPDCPAAARVGEIAATAGAGGEPLHLTGGKVYLGGPYQGAPFSLISSLPVALGKVDLGALLMRLPMRLDPRDGHLTIAAVLPHSPAGVALNLRELSIKIDRPGFIVNPTGCGSPSVQGQVEGDGGSMATVSSPLGIVGCRGLGFRPRLKIGVLAGRNATKHGGHPTFSVVLTRPAGNANFASTVISFPGTEQLDPTRLQAACHVAVAACPPSSIYGHVKAFSPLFATPLAGPVYLLRSSHRLPDLVAVLHGQIGVELKGTLGFANGRMRVTMGSIPDLPVSKLRLMISGGKRGLLINNRDLCRSPSFSTAVVEAQNGRAVRRHPKLGTPCPPPPSASPRSRR